MSLDLSVPLNGKIDFNSLLISTKAVLLDLLAQKSLPKINVSKLSQGKIEPVSLESFGEDGDCYLVALDGFEDAVELVFIDLDKLECCDDELSGFEVGISVGVNKSPIEFALAAGLAISISKTQNTHIIDEGNIWTNQHKISSNDFELKLRLNTCEEDLLQAVKCFHNRLNHIT